jgi:hypothetical protein
MGAARVGAIACVLRRMVFIPLLRLRLERQMVGGEDCLRIENPSSAAAPVDALRPKDEAAAGCDFL